MGSPPLPVRAGVVQSDARSVATHSFRRISEWECRTIPPIYAFGPFRLDAQAVTLFLGAEPVALSKRAVALLRILVERAGRAGLQGRAHWGGMAWPRGRG